MRISRALNKCLLLALLLPAVCRAQVPYVTGNVAIDEDFSWVSQKLQSVADVASSASTSSLVEVTANPYQFTGTGTSTSPLTLNGSSVTLMGPINNITQIPTRSHNSLSDIGSMSHAQLETALTGKLSTSAAISPALVNLSTVTEALANKLTAPATFYVVKASDYLQNPATFYVPRPSDYQAPGAYITALTGNVVASGPGASATTIVSVPASAVNLSTVTSALALKANASDVIPSSATGTYALSITGNAETVSNGLYNNSSFDGDVYGLYNHLYVRDDSHSHTGATLSGVIQSTATGEYGITAAASRSLTLFREASYGTTNYPTVTSGFSSGNNCTSSYSTDRDNILAADGLTAHVYASCTAGVSGIRTSNYGYNIPESAVVHGVWVNYKSTGAFPTFYLYKDGGLWGGVAGTSDGNDNSIYISTNVTAEFVNSSDFGIFAGGVSYGTVSNVYFDYVNVFVDYSLDSFYSVGASSTAFIVANSTSVDMGHDVFTVRGSSVGIWKAYPGYRLDVEGGVNSTLGFYENGAKVGSASLVGVRYSTDAVSTALINLSTVTASHVLKTGGTMTGTLEIANSQLWSHASSISGTPGLSAYPVYSACGGTGKCYSGYFTSTGTGTNYGVYAIAQNGANNYAGYFVGDVLSSGIFYGSGSGLSNLPSGSLVGGVPPSLVDLSTVTTALADKQATGNYITALTGNVTATGPGSVSATIVSVPQSAVNLSTVTTALASKLDYPVSSPVSLGSYALTTSSDVVAHAYYGDGSHLTGISGTGDSGSAKATILSYSTGTALTTGILGNIVVLVSTATPFSTFTLPALTESDIGASTSFVKHSTATIVVNACSGCFIADSPMNGKIYNTLESYATLELLPTTTFQWSITGGDGRWIVRD